MKQATTQNRVKSILRAFFGWCEQTGLVERSPARSLRLAPVHARSTRWMTPPEIRRFLGAMRRAGDALARRDHALFATLLYTGIRLSEAVALQRSDLDLRRKFLLLRRTKGGASAQRCVPDRLVAILVRYLSRESVDPAVPLFATQRGVALSPRTVQYRFAGWLERAGIKRRLTVHSLRHSFGTLLYQATTDIVLVGRALGHRDLKSNQRYAHLDDRRMAKVLNRVW